MNLSRFRTLTDAEFLRVARDAQDPLTSTEIQDELLIRFEKIVEDGNEFEQIKTRLADTGTYIDTEAGIDGLIELLHVANEHYCGEAVVLKTKLQRADDFYDIVAEAGDLFKRLADLAATTV